MLSFERSVVGALMDPAADAERRRAITDYVDTNLRSMPEHLRAGVFAESLVLQTWVRVSARPGTADERRLRARVERWQYSRIDLVRQYVRLLQSLVLFAENELEPAAA
ncbi:MAG TPA: hypothetical protein VFX21_03910 [Acidimicrobiia bacterium]|nr:hypothetical protein [Acidimicrobiia bacterium]